MSSESVQSSESHRRWVIGYHFVTSAILLANAIYAIYTLVVDPSAATIFATLTGIALVMLFLYARTFPLGVQDRLIRLEERLRISRLLPDDLASRAESLTPKQCVAIRFASDDELEDLVRTVLNDGISKQNEIKKLIKTWRPDNNRI